MDNGEISLRAELGKMENPEEIKKLAEDAEMSGYEDVAKMAQEKLAEIKAKIETVGKTTESQVRQVESVGGNEQEVARRTEEVDQKIAEVEAKAAEEVKKVESENVENTEGEIKQGENIEISIAKQQLEDKKRSLEKNLQAKESLASIGGKNVKSSEYLRSALGVPLMMVEETKVLRDLIRKRNSYERGNPERDKAQAELIKFQSENTNDTIEFNFGSSPEDSSVLVKGINGVNINSVTSLNNAIDQIIKDQETTISELENKINPENPLEENK